MIKKYQQGGTSNIAIGSPKPYTANLPGINLSGIQGALTNAPIEINTTSIFDQLDKMQRLKLDADKLKFQYEELKYKEGKAYMDFAADMMKTMQTSVKSNLSGIGGFSSMPRYEPVIRSYNERMAEVREKFTRGFQNRDPHAAMNLLNEVSKIQTDPDYMDAMVEIGTLEKLIEPVLKNPGVVSTQVISKALEFASDPNADFSKFMGGVTPYLGNNLKSNDIFKIFEDYRTSLHTSTKGTKTVTGPSKILPSGQVEDQYTFAHKSPELIAGDLATIFMSSPGTKQYLETEVHTDGTPVNPENPQDVLRYFMPVAQGLHNDIKSSFVPTTERNKDILKDINVVDGRVVSTPKPGDEDGTGGKQTEAEKKRNARMAYFFSEYPGVDLDEFINLKISEGKEEDWFKEVQDYLSKKGINPKGGVKAAEKSNRLSINSLDELGIPIDPKRTKIVENNGNRFLVTNQEQVMSLIDNKWKDSTKVLEDAWDMTVRKEMGLKGGTFSEYNDRPDEWNTIPADPNTTVYKIEPKGAASQLGGLDSGTPVDIKSSGLPIKGSTASGFVSSDLVNQLKDILPDLGVSVTSASDGSHKSDMQSKHGTSVDINFDDGTTEDTIQKIPTVIERMQRRGLRAVYEVKTQSEKDRVLKLNPDIKSGDVAVVPTATANHFSIYCDYCKQVEAKGKQNSTTGNQSKQIEAARNLPPTSLGGIIGE